ncbi:hypothetical protein ESA_02333 [Cronobacter sakazakii ATCC BAA-894]|uniref:Uncharacterized protein n=1 Tax=Cronobacter sakazakii (strain ATCC BAA-894) TaxID=290339 RepID=A7MG06_CROS8|nr:hypothetical protein ESA_02333 [Cronobacter sakazakii ATCC BAA-894]
MIVLKVIFYIFNIGFYFGMYFINKWIDVFYIICYFIHIASIIIIHYSM